VPHGDVGRLQAAQGGWSPGELPRSWLSGKVLRAVSRRVSRGAQQDELHALAGLGTGAQHPFADYKQHGYHALTRI
jgi:hypothetical protein